MISWRKVLFIKFILLDFPLLSASCPPLCDRGQLVAPLFLPLKLKVWWFRRLKIKSPLLSGGQLGCPLISRSWNKIQSEIPLLAEWRKSLSNPSISKSLVVQSYLLTYVDRTPGRYSYKYPQNFRPAFGGPNEFSHSPLWFIRIPPPLKRFWL